MQIYPQITPHLAKVKKLFSSLMPVIITFFGACCYLSDQPGGFSLKFKPLYIYKTLVTLVTWLPAPKNLYKSTIMR